MKKEEQPSMFIKVKNLLILISVNTVKKKILKFVLLN
jgi:hypothetical protein